MNDTLDIRAKNILPRWLICYLPILFVIITLTMTSTKVFGDVQFHCGENKFDAPMALTVINSLYIKKKAMDCGKATINIFIKGEITKSDAEWFNEYNEKKPIVNPETVVLALDSLGGDLVSALSVAQNIRSSGSTGYLVVIGEDAKCYSACTIILAAGYQKVVYGTVGLHRPYLSSELANSYGYTDLKKFYDSLHEKLNVYFKSVNINGGVLDIMWSTPSHSVHIMTQNELSATGLGINDSILTEKDNIKLRQMCGPDGLSMKENFINTWGKCLEDNNQEAGSSPECWKLAKSENQTYFNCRYPNGFNN